MVRGRDVEEAGNQRLERLLAERLAGRGQRAHREAVISAVARDDLVAVLPRMRAASVLPCHLERRLDRFRAAIDEEHAAQFARQKRAEARRQLRRRPMRLRQRIIR